MLMLTKMIKNVVERSDRSDLVDLRKLIVVIFGALLKY